MKLNLESKKLTTENLKSSLKNKNHTFIESENLCALKILQSVYEEKINFIYIDPPYNTGKKFTYNDNFFNENWLNFMQLRLEIAKNLLKEDGCIFIAIGQESLYELKILCDKIFGTNNFVNNFLWLCGKGKKDKFSRTMFQSHLCYAKNKKKLAEFVDFETTSWAKTNLDNDIRGPWFSASISFDEKRSNSRHPNFYEIISPSGIKWNRQWFISKNEMNDLLLQNKIYWGTFPEFKNVPRKKIFNGEKIPVIPKNIIENAGTTRAAQIYLDNLLGIHHVFDNPKPVDLIKHFIKIANMPKDITVLDFFAGSGTTFESVLKLNQEDNGNRKCILIQKAEKIQQENCKFSTISELCLQRMIKILPENQKLTFLQNN